MRIIIVLLLFAGMAILVHSVYEEKLQQVQKNVRVEYRFLPRTLYEEQIEQGGNLAADNQKMFTRKSPWPGA